MKIVIELNEEDREKIKNAHKGFFLDLYKVMTNAINNGFEIPKGHGRLIDADELLDCSYEIDSIYGVYDKVVNVDDINNAPTIIEADKEADEMEQKKPIFPCIEGALAEMYVDGKWIKGKIVKGYRFDDGVVTIEDDNGQQYWCGQDRTDLYRRYRR